jgi:hypothetical protein
MTSRTPSFLTLLNDLTIHSQFLAENKTNAHPKESLNAFQVILCLIQVSPSLPATGQTEGAEYSIECLQYNWCHPGLPFGRKPRNLARESKYPDVRILGVLDLARRVCGCHP